MSVSDVVGDELAASPASRRIVTIWLVAVSTAVLAMIVIGGVTRLTDSGLSMVDWRPIMGILPPLSDAEWEATFAAYRAFPEYQLINRGMDLAGFKAIFFWEYFHRVTGRVIGLVFFVPFVLLLWRGRIERHRVLPLVGALVLGGMQGLLGWYMVKSGLVDRPDVSHLRLAAHLSLAFFVLAYLAWLILDLWREPARDEHAAVPRGLLVVAGAFCLLLVTQIVWGAFVAGLKAGIGFNTWPLMNGEFLPAVVASGHAVHDHFTVQFVHRWLGAGVLTGAACLSLYAAIRGVRGRLGVACHVVLAITCLQFLLGVTTLVMVVPISLAALHQAGAAVLLLSVVVVLHGAWYGRAQARVAANDAGAAPARPIQ